MFFPWTNKNAVYLSIGITVPFLITYYCIEQNVDNFPSINILWYGPIAITMVTTIGIIGSKAMGLQDPNVIPSNLLSPYVLKFLSGSTKYKRNLSAERPMIMVNTPESPS